MTRILKGKFKKVGTPRMANLLQILHKFSNLFKKLLINSKNNRLKGILTRQNFQKSYEFV